MTHTAPRVRTPGGYREVVCLALPVVVSMLTQTLTSALESAFLGRFGTVEQGAAGQEGQELAARVHDVSSTWRVGGVIGGQTPLQAWGQTRFPVRNRV